MKQIHKNLVQVPYGVASKMARDIGCNVRHVTRALQYESMTAPSQIKIRQLAIEKYGGKDVKITIKE